MTTGPYLTLAEAAQELQITVWAVRKAARRYELSGGRIGLATERQELGGHARPLVVTTPQAVAAYAARPHVRRWQRHLDAAPVGG